jgi:hypothetical protein
MVLLLVQIVLGKEVGIARAEMAGCLLGCGRHLALPDGICDEVFDELSNRIELILGVADRVAELSCVVRHLTVFRADVEAGNSEARQVERSAEAASAAYFFI